jgi:hypothetical protein
VRLGHLSNRYVIHRPGDGVAADARLRLSINAPSHARGGEAGVLIWHTSGEVQTRRVALGRDGDGNLRVPFGRGDVRMVVAVLTNASARFADCGSGFPFSCGGLSRDDNLPFRLTSRLLHK